MSYYGLIITEWIIFIMMTRSQSSNELDFENAMKLMLIDYSSTDPSYNQMYTDYIYKYSKINDYLLDGSDNYIELNAHYLRYIESDNLVIDLNKNYFDTVPYGHTFFSDILDDDRMALLMTNPPDSAGSTDSDICRIIIKDPYNGWNGKPYGNNHTFINTHCDGINNQYQHEDGSGHSDSWAFAPASQAECNYNLANNINGCNANNSPWNETCTNTECQAIQCNVGGKSPLIVNEYYVETGYCPLFKYPMDYPTCLSYSCQPNLPYFNCASTPKLAKSCNIYSIDDPIFDFRAANRRLSWNLTAMNFNIMVGQDFFNINEDGGSSPIKSVCLKPFNTTQEYRYHSMTFIATTLKWTTKYGSLKVKNSFGTKWGDNGYFWISAEAYADCKGSGITYNEWEME